MAEVPPLVQQTAISCTVTDAIFYGQAKGKDAAGKDVDQKYYEVACQEGLGYIIQSTVGGETSAFDCLAMSRLKPKPGEPDKGQVYCRMAANADPLKAFGPLVAAAGTPSCSVTQAQYIGSSPTDKVDEYEVVCADNHVLVLQSPRKDSPKKPVTVDCMTLDPGKCTLLTKDKYVANLAAMAQPSGRPCQVSDGRYIGTSSSSRNSFYEIACADGKAGYVLQVDGAGKFVGAIDCARATGLAGGCTLTSASAAQTEENATYSKLAKAVGYNCDVKSYHSFGQDQATGREVVELACNDHADGAIALLPVDKGQKGEYFNCVRAAIRTLKCSLTNASDTYAKISSEISSAGKSCQVTNARAVGTSKDGADFVEVACATGAGQMVEYSPGAEAVKAVTPCPQAADIGGGCKLGK
jgi:hypothetical protein